ncbi:MAG TPA: periplasmic heavy metal sensor [Nitrospiria bacterium]|nr:periplasmic heavy metal sensor [Nitrospiria bacterium]HUK55156.1 periplasmic heavy metal sensor [Nitrospiria bacterium]
MSNTTMTKKSRLSLALVLGALLVGGAVLATGVLADSGPRAMMGRHCDMHRGDMRDRVGHALHGLIRSQKALGLSADQETKIKAIALEHEKSRIQSEADMKLANLDVRADIFNEKVELPTIESALQKSESARTAMRLEGVKALRAAAAVLTPEQREKWHQRMMPGHEAGAGRNGHGHGPMAHPNDMPEKQG